MKKEIKSKICTTCGIEKSINEFHKVTNKGIISGYHGKCKKCFQEIYGQKKIIKKHTAIRKNGVINQSCPFYKEDNYHLPICVNPVLLEQEFILDCVLDGNTSIGTCAIPDRTINLKTNKYRRVRR